MIEMYLKSGVIDFHLWLDEAGVLTPETRQTYRLSL